MTETADLTGDGASGGGTSGGGTSGEAATGGGGSRRSAARRWVARHRLVTVAAVVCVAAVTAVSVIASGSSGSASGSADPKAPGFSLPALGASGQHVTLAQYAGKPLIVNFWASWCPPCQKETPLLAAFYRDQRGRVAIVGLDENDSAAAALKFAHAKGVSYPIGFDPGLTASNAYGVYGLPQTFVLNAQHRIVEHLYGALTAAELTRALTLMHP